MDKTLNRVRNGYTYAGHSDLTVCTCPLCGIVYAIPERLRAHAESQGEGKLQWFCPNGHQLGYQGESEADRANRLLQRARERATAEADLRRHTERQLSAQRGATTKAKKRHAAGLCPCCNRSFVQLKRHMEAKHPDYNPAHTVAPNRKELDHGR